jgi:hypothetical protein
MLRIKWILLLFSSRLADLKDKNIRLWFALKEEKFAYLCQSLLSPCDSLVESQASQLVDVKKLFVSRNPETSLQLVWQAQTKQERLQG